jgi:hypothetical protein
MKVYLEFPDIMNQLLERGRKVLRKAKAIKEKVEETLESTIVRVEYYLI